MDHQPAGRGPPSRVIDGKRYNEHVVWRPGPFRPEGDFTDPLEAHDRRPVGMGILFDASASKSTSDPQDPRSSTKTSMGIG